jgi:hypothetical protein
MTFATFVGTIGGQAGLWLGASVITFIKIVMICSNLLYHNVQKKLT